MSLEPYMIFILSFGFNLFVRYGLRFLGKLRLGLDSLLFCAIAVGYTSGMYNGFLYGALISALFCALSTRWTHAIYMIPLNGFVGAIAGMLQSFPFSVAALLVVIAYHASTFYLARLVTRGPGMNYIVFVITNIIATSALLVLLNSFL